MAVSSPSSNKATGPLAEVPELVVVRAMRIHKFKERSFRHGPRTQCGLTQFTEHYALPELKLGWSWDFRFLKIV